TTPNDRSTIHITAPLPICTAYNKKGESKNRSLHIVETFSKMENFLFPIIDEQEKVFHLKELNEQGEEKGLSDISTNKIKTIFNLDRKSTRLNYSHVKITYA